MHGTKSQIILHATTKQVFSYWLLPASVEQETAG
jgi:hypothetical protein